MIYRSHPNEMITYTFNQTNYSSFGTHTDTAMMEVYLPFYGLWKWFVDNWKHMNSHTTTKSFYLGISALSA